MIKKIVIFSVFLSVLVSILSFINNNKLLAQTGPTTQPRVLQGDMVYLGKFTVPSTDNAGIQITYGSNALGMGADGVSMYIGCVYGSSLARISIPSIGGTAQVLENCSGVPNLSAINPTDPNGYRLGGTLAWQGKLIVTGYSFYDGASTASASHWSGTTISGASGPYKIGPEKPAFVAGYMGVIPTEWRTLLGGPALTGQCCLSIISRTSSGPSVSVFDPAQVGGTNVSKMLLGYPEAFANNTVGTYGNPGPVFSGSTQVGGMAFPDGTRSLLFIEKHHGAGSYCYGEGTANQSLHGTPVPGFPTVIYCYDPTDVGNKGTHGYPYNHLVVAYDANELVAVNQGTKNPWDVVPYATWIPTEMNNSGTAKIAGATYDPATKRWYITQDLGGGTPTVHVYQINIGTVSTSPTVDIKANNSDSLTIANGASATLTWTSANVTSCTVTPGGWTGTTGSQSTGALSATATYTISCTGTNGTAVDSVVVNVTPPAQQEPIGHWRLDSSSGTTALDSSTNSNHGTLTNSPVWSTGKIGNALTFNGVDNYVSVNNTNSVFNPSKITLSTWIKPANITAGGVVIGKGDTSEYYLRLYSSSLAFLLNVNGTQVSLNNNYTFTNSIWYHISGTYDGSTMRVYVNGTEIGNQAVAGSIVATNSNLIIGKRGPTSGNYFSGSVDDVRIYNRALTGTEITALYNVVGGDTTPPTVSISSPSSGTVTGSVSVTATANDNVGVSGVQFKLDGANLGTLDTTSPYSVTWDTTTATNGTHTLTAVASDAVGNTTTSSPVSVTVNNAAASTKFIIGDNVETTSSVNVRSTANGTLLGTQATGARGTVVGGPTYTGGYHWWNINYDTGVDGWSAEDFLIKFVNAPLPPTISNITESNITTSGATVSWTTSEPADTQVEYGLTTAYGSNTSLNASMVTSHSSALSGLTSNTLYHYRVKSKDAGGNLAQSADQTFTTLPPADVTSPVITNIVTSGITDTSANIAWATNENSNTQVEYGTSTSYGFSTTLNTNMVLSHSAGLNDLIPSTLYHYRVKSRDAAGNLGQSADQTFTTLSGTVADITPPVISAVTATSITTSSTTITWTTNEVATSLVEYGTSTSYGQSSQINTTLLLSHSVKLTSLKRRTTYNYRVISADAAGNVSTSSNFTFKTGSRLTTTPTLTDVSAANGSVVLSWKEPLDEDSEVYELFDGTLIMRSASAFIMTPNTATALANLKPNDKKYKDDNVENGKTYYYSLFSYDDLGNYSVPSLVSFTPTEKSGGGGSGGGGGGGGGGGSGGGTDKGCTPGVMYSTVTGKKCKNYQTPASYQTPKYSTPGTYSTPKTYATPAYGTPGTEGTFPGPINLKSTTEVKKLQTVLNKVLKIFLKVDGVYGKSSLGAVKSFQSANFLKPDGVLGPLTRAKLNAVK